MWYFYVLTYLKKVFCKIVTKSRFVTSNSFSSSNNQLRIPNISNDFFVYLFFQWCYQVKVLNYITIQPKNANITLYIKKLKTLCNTLNWGNWNSEFRKLVVPMSWMRYKSRLHCMYIEKNIIHFPKNYQITIG